jgi:hypothetical protein
LLDSQGDRWSFNQTVGPGIYDGIKAGYPSGGDADYLSVMTTAQSYLNAALDYYDDYASNDPVPTTVTVSALTKSTSGGPWPSPVYEQDLLIFGAVPEPQTYALAAGLGLFGFGLYRRMGRKS